MNVSKVDDFINAIKSTQKNSVHIDAYSHLEKEETEQACEIWEKYNKQHPDDHVSNHHLSIIYHSKAWELEHKGMCVEALHHWKKALSYWARFLKANEFWNDHTRKMIEFATEGKGIEYDKFWSIYVTQKRNLPEEFRDENIVKAKWNEALDHWFRYGEIPSWWDPFAKMGIKLGGVNLKEFSITRMKLAKALLLIHYSLSWHYISDKKYDKAREHMEIILKTDFHQDVKPDEIKKEIRIALADKVILDKSELKDVKHFEQGVLKHSDHFERPIGNAALVLQVDPENPEVYRILEFIVWCYYEWNNYLCQQEDLLKIEQNMNDINKERYMDKLDQAINNPICPEIIRLTLKNELLRIREPIVRLYNINAVNLWKRFDELSSAERTDLKRYMGYLVQHGNGIISDEQLDIIRSIHLKL